jgi:hypothetical protein
MRIGIDFDNTIITYDGVFLSVAKTRGLVSEDFCGSKQAIRDHIRRLPDGEVFWQELQGQVYGKGITGAAMFEGFDSFLRRCRKVGYPVLIVSHKTEYGHYDPDRINLRQAALDWMTTQGLFDGDLAIPPENVFFESTRAEKLKRIASLRLTHFIDDLEEVLSDADFPTGVKRILFTKENPAAAAPYICCPTWPDIERQVFCGASS